MNRVPGSITNRGVGMRRRKHLGWRTFDIKAPDVVAEDPNNHISASATTGGNTVVTFNGACTDETNDAIEMAIFGAPLTNNYGEPINFRHPFSLKLQIEFIGCTGDYFDDGGGGEVIPCFGLGIGQKASDFINTDNHFLMQGFVFNSDADPPALKMYNNRSSSETNFTVNTGSSMDPGHGLQHATIFVGPAVGSIKDSESVSIISQATKYSGNSYQQTDNPQGIKYDFNLNSTFDSDDQVYLYAFFGTNNSDLVAPNPSADPPVAGSYGSKTVPVLTCRLRYLVTSDSGGWGGSGT
mgnify:CR=1 FL=1